MQAQAGYLADPHTACGVVAAETCLGGSAPHPEIVLAAISAKFPDAMESYGSPAGAAATAYRLMTSGTVRGAAQRRGAVAGYVELTRARGEAAP